MQEELIELQTQLSFQDKTITELNDALIIQQQQLDMLKLEIQLLKEKLEGIEGNHDIAPQDETPPHY